MFGTQIKKAACRPPQIADEPHLIFGGVGFFAMI